MMNFLNAMPFRSFFVFCLLSFSLLTTACKDELSRLRNVTDADVLAKKGKEFYDKGKWANAQAVYELVMPAYRGRPELERIAFEYAYTHYHLRNYLSSNYYFKNFASTYVNSPLREEADFMLAYSEYKQSPVYKLDQTNTAKAIDGFQAFINTYPESKRAKECNNLIDGMRAKLEQKAFAEGKLYYDIKQFQAAIQVFEAVLRDYPDTDNAELIRYRILQSAYRFADESIVERQVERYKVVQDKYDDFIKKFPKSKYRKDAESYLKDATLKLKALSNV